MGSVLASQCCISSVASRMTTAKLCSNEEEQREAQSLENDLIVFMEMASMDSFLSADHYRSL